MRERARLLKYGPRDPAWLDGLETEMAEAGVAIAAARAATVARLNAMLAERGEAGAFPCAALALDGEIDGCSPKAAMARGACARASRAARIRDAEAGRTPSGRISPILPCATRKSAPTRANAPPASRRRC